MISIRLRICLFSVLAASTYSCSTFKDDGRLSEGIIEYKVTYPKMDPNSILAELLPTRMVMSFKGNQFMTDLAAGFGMFRMNVINKGEDKNISQMVKLINERFVVNYDEVSAVESVNKMPKVKIERTGKTKKIAGFKCSEVKVRLLGDSVETYKIYYTDEIHIDHPNWFTQFSDIEGVLMEYQVERYNLCTKFTAEKVTPQEVDRQIFKVPQEYKEIEEDEMNKKMEEIFNSFSE